MLQKRDGRTRVYRRRNERFARNCILEVGPSPLRCCTIGPSQVDVDVSVLRQSKNVWWVHSRFHGDGFWLSVPVFVGDLGYLAFRWRHFSQYLLYLPLACSTARTHQQPNIVTSGYFTWETGPWQQEKQHQISQVSDEYGHRQSETVSVKTAMHPPDVHKL
jgi:hypothetical protein